MLNRSNTLNALLNAHDLDLVMDLELHDSACTTGYDNDGSTGFEIFQNGLELGSVALDQPIFLFLSESSKMALFFIGEEKEILEKIRSAIEEAFKQ